MNPILVLSDISPRTWSQELTAEPKIVGRAPSAEIHFQHRSVSRHHCRFWKESGVCYVEDCGSTNGTRVNGKRTKKKALQKGDRILVGKFEFILAANEQFQTTCEFVLSEMETWEMDSSSTETQYVDEFDEERHLASAIHRRLTPSRRLALPGLLIEVAYAPSGLLGGDCFECFELNNYWTLAILDPMSHGTKAALTIMFLRSELQRFAELGHEPAECLDWINHEIASVGIGDLYICGSMAKWFPQTQTMVSATAGQHPPLIIRDGKVLNLDATAGGFPLGTAPEDYTEQLLQLAPLDRLFFFTDGVGPLMSSQRDRKRSVNTVELIAKKLLENQNEELEIQVQAVFENPPNSLLDDALLVGCEVTDED